jgi:hypothetical protein
VPERCLPADVCAGNLGPEQSQAYVISRTLR